MTGTETAVALMLAFVNQAAAIGTLINNARAEGRDVSITELDTLAANDDAVRAALNAEIARQRE